MHADVPDRISEKLLQQYPIKDQPGDDLSRVNVNICHLHPYLPFLFESGGQFGGQKESQKMEEEYEHLFWNNVWRLDCNWLLLHSKIDYQERK